MAQHSHRPGLGILQSQQTTRGSETNRELTIFGSELIPGSLVALFRDVARRGRDDDPCLGCRCVKRDLVVHVVARKGTVRKGFRGLD